MFDAHIQNIMDVFIVEGIKNGFAVSARFDELIGFQNAELVRYGGLGQIQKSRDITDAKLPLKKRIQNRKKWMVYVLITRKG